MFCGIFNHCTITVLYSHLKCTILIQGVGKNENKCNNKGRGGGVSSAQCMHVNKTSDANTAFDLVGKLNEELVCEEIKG